MFIWFLAFSFGFSQVEEVKEISWSEDFDISYKYFPRIIDADNDFFYVVSKTSKGDKQYILKLNYSGELIPKATITLKGKEMIPTGVVEFEGKNYLNFAKWKTTPESFVWENKELGEKKSFESELPFEAWEKGN
ncbi:MAG: hypothetical protein ACI9O4_001210 [Chitinophagales bacterium]